MSWRDAVGSVLHRTTGYTLTRETPEQRSEALARAARRAAAEARRAVSDGQRRELRQREQQRQAERAERARERAVREAAAEEARRQREAHLHARRVARFDEELWATVERVQPQTMTGPAKLAALVEATRYVARHRVPGDVVECGVWRGGSMQAIALTLLSRGDVDRELHLFDTFEGMPPPTAEDARTTEVGAVPADQMLAESDRESALWAIAGLDVVKQAMADTGYPADKVHFHPGLVEDTTPGQAPDTIALLRLDTDWYASTKHELEHLYDRLSPGGVLILDDYGDWDGARKATDEWLAETGEQIFLAPMGSGVIGIKPMVGRA
ncbi:MAG: TylF/MycF/NovP-related O-methyltransferase [Nocardioides sp.]